MRSAWRSRAAVRSRLSWVAVGQSGEQSLKRIESAGARASGGLKRLGRQAELLRTGIRTLGGALSVLRRSAGALIDRSLGGRCHRQTADKSSVEALQELRFEGVAEQQGGRGGPGHGREGHARADGHCPARPERQPAPGLATPALGLIADEAVLGAVFLASTLVVLCPAAIAVRLLNARALDR